jgi:hypothetical protein
MCVDFSDRICRTCSVTVSCMGSVQGRDGIDLNLTCVGSQLILFPIFRVGLVAKPLKWPIQPDHFMFSTIK